MPAQARPVMPRRVASLDRCTDELALLLAAPGQLVSISRAGADPRQSIIADRAHGLPTNRGGMDEIAALNPDLLLTSAANAGAAMVGRQLGIAVENIVPPRSIADVRNNIRNVARALGRPAEGEALVAQMNGIAGMAPIALQPGVMMLDGRRVDARSLAAEWLRKAGIAIADGPVAADVLLVTTNGARIDDDRRRVETDARAWVCAGPPLATEIARLRHAVQRVEPMAKPRL